MKSRFAFFGDRYKFFNVASVLIIGLSFVSILSQPSCVQARNIKVGIIDCYSGPAAVYANDALKGFKLALEEISKEGVVGSKIDFTTRDTEFKVDIALTMARELVMREDCDVLVGVINSDAAMAVSERVAKIEKVPFIVWTAKSDRITGEKGHRYVFSTSENTAMIGKAAGVALSRKPYVKYWVAGDDYEYGHAIGKTAWQNLKQSKPHVEKIGESWWKPGEPDLIPYIASILAAKPDAVIFCTGGGSMINIMKAVKATDMARKVPIYIHSATDPAILELLGGEAPEGVMGTTDYHFYYPDRPENRTFAKDYETRYGRPPSSSTFHGYITAKFIAGAFQKAGSRDKEKFIDALEGLKVDSPAGKIEMRRCDHQAVLPMHLGITKREPGRDHIIASDIITLTGDEVMPSCEEIMKARGK